MESAVSTSVPGKAPRRPGLALAIASGLGLAYILTLLAMVATHTWLFDASGRPQRIDFLSFQVAGSLALHGSPLAAYSASALHAAAVARVGHEFREIFPWPYPPLFFFVAVPLACLPFAVAFVLWVGTMVMVYGAIVAAIAKRYAAFLLSWSPPWAVLATMNGQNGFLTASLIGVVLLNLERRPAVAGFVLGLLSYKPQYGFLFPFAFAFGGYWRAFGWACLGTVFWTVLSCSVFGFDTLIACVHGLSHSTADLHAMAGIGWDKIQSVYGFSRWCGIPEKAAWALQLCTALACVVAVASLWREQYAFSLKAAGLIALAPLVTPYAFIYDFPLLSIALAWLYRDAPFNRTEALLISFAVVCTGLFVLHTYSAAGPLACLAVAAIVLRRCQRTSASECKTHQTDCWANATPPSLETAVTTRATG
ncbi:MAG TPA: glycosyltransferase family 87 protein [Rhizomicrobium sp.]|nr:glycosyltransferase family 87 protein [Rhizomicrobium sp.]